MVGKGSTPVRLIMEENAMDEDGITLTCKLGRFTFNRNVLISKAKRIRDEVMGQWFNPRPGSTRLYTEDDIEAYVRNEHHLRDVAGIPFEVVVER